MQKRYDLAWSDQPTSENPNWYCQLKFRVSQQNTAARALGDLFWGLIDREHIQERYERDVNMVFVWIEHNEQRRDDGFLHFDDGVAEMTLNISPGYSDNEEGYCGEFRYGKLIHDKDDRNYNPWWDREAGVLTPNNPTVLSQLLAVQTGTSYYRQYNQRGLLQIITNFEQLRIGEWHIYVHQLVNWELTDVPDGVNLINWVP